MFLQYDALIQPHFDYACLSWFPNLTEKAKENTIYAKLMHMDETFEFAPHSSNDARNIILQGLSTLLTRLTRSRKPHHTLVPIFNLHDCTFNITALFVIIIIITIASSMLVAPL